MVDVYVIGEGPVELAAALEFAEVGLSVRIGRAATSGGAAFAAGAADGGGADRADEARAGFSPDEVTDPDGTLRAFLDHVASPLSPGGAPLTGARPISEAPVPVLLRGADRAWTMQPTPAVLGIPAVPLSRESLAVLGRRGAARAFLDRVRPVLTIGKTRSLGRLVRSRLGKSAFDRLVDPIARAKYGVSADQVDVAIAAPGLNEDVTTAGSLCGAALAYAERHVARETRVRPSAGWEALREALLERLALYGAEVAGAPVVGVRRIGAAAGDESDAADGPGAGDASAPGADSDRGEATEWLIEEAGVRIPASAVVMGDRAVGLPGVPAEGQVPEASSMRWVAELDVTAPDFVTAARAVAGRRAALETVAAPNGELWSVAWESALGDSKASTWRIRFAGPARDVDGAGAPRAEALADVRAAIDTMLRDVLDTSGARRTDPDLPVDLRMVPALFASVEARDRSLLHTTSPVAAESTCLRVGPAVHSGDLAAAVAEARERSVHLRRRLTGIAE